VIKYIKSINNTCFTVTLSSLGVYLGNKTRDIDLPGFLYIALVLLAGLIITSLIIHSKKKSGKAQKIKKQANC
jgi:hypothetical protein